MFEHLKDGDYWICLLLRVAKTICETAVAVIGTAKVMGDVDWIYVASASCLAGILCIFMNIGGLPEAGGSVGGVR